MGSKKGRGEEGVSVDYEGVMKRAERGEKVETKDERRERVKIRVHYRVYLCYK